MKNHPSRFLLGLGLLAPLACASGSTASPASAPASMPAAAATAPAGTIVDVASASGQFGTLIAALEAADLVGTLRGAGPFTVFAPNDAAFAKLPKETLDSLLADKAKLTSILTYHVVPGRVMAADVGGLDKAPTVNGASLPIDASNGVKVGSAKVIATDVPATNGVIHVIDTVLVPES